jgi:hypothetical protein
MIRRRGLSALAASIAVCTAAACAAPIAAEDKPV